MNQTFLRTNFRILRNIVLNNWNKREVNTNETKSEKISGNFF